MDNILMDAARRAAKYLEQSGRRSISPSPDAILGLERFRIPLQNQPIPAEKVLAELDELGSPKQKTA